MCLVSYEQLAPAYGCGASYYFGDVHFWGGFRENQRMIAVCDAFHWVSGCTAIGAWSFHGSHAPPRRGIRRPLQMPSTVTTTIRWTTSSHNPFVYKDGCFTVPTGPGLGYGRLDQEEKYNWLYKSQDKSTNSPINGVPIGCRHFPSSDALQDKVEIVTGAVRVGEKPCPA